MQSVPLVSVGVLAPLLEYLERANAREVLRSLSYAVEPGLRRRALVPFLTGGIALARAADALGAPDIGLRIAEGAAIDRIGDLGTLLSSAPTVGAALATGVKDGMRHYNTGARVWLTIRGDEAWFHRSFVRSLETGRQQVSDYGIRLWLSMIQRAAGQGWRPSEIHFEGRPPKHADRLRELAHVVRFEQPFTAIVFPRALLALPMPPPAKRLHARPGTRGAAPAADALGTLRQAVEALVSMGEPSLRAAADAAGTSVRSLQRQLAGAGQSFHGLLDQARCSAACGMLADEDRKVIEVALAVGYTDAANFTRAFRRWTGTSPQEFRRLLLLRRASEPLGMGAELSASAGRP